MKLAFSPDGRWLAVGEAIPPHFGGRGRGHAARLRIWDTATGEAGPAIQAAPSPNGFPSAAFDPRGGRIAVTTGADGVDVYDLRDGRQVLACRFPEGGSSSKEAWDVAFSPDGRRLAAPSYWCGAVTLWDCGTGKVDRVLPHPPARAAIDRLAFSHDGRRLAHSYGGEVWVWDVSSAEPVAACAGLVQEVLAFHPGGGRLFNAGNGRAELLDLRTSQSVLRLPETYCQAAAFSPDGHRLAVADGPVVRMYDATPRAGFPKSERAPGPLVQPRGTARPGPVLVAAASAVAALLLVLLLWRFALRRLRRGR